MNRRSFFGTLGAAALARPLASAPKTFPLGLNTYCLRSLNWHDRKLLDYAAGLKLDAVFLQDSKDPETMNPAHWKTVRDWSRELGLHLETGGGAVLPKTPGQFKDMVQTLGTHIRRAAAMGSPLVRCLVASDRASLPPGPAEQHMETMVRLLKEIKPQVVDAGLKLAIEVHKDFQAWEHKQVIEAAGTDFVGVYMDTGNPVFVHEHPLTTLETLGPYVLTLHLRDSVVYEHPKGVAVQWVPLGEGTVDFKQIIATASRLCPNVHVYIKPITGRPPAILPIYDENYWKSYPKARASDMARFLALAKSGRPYEGHVVIEDLQNRPIPPQFLQAVQFQQQEHMERSVEYAKKTLGLGVRWQKG
ncbi:MAG TPA: TIM barrel protein [Bryobacteraceae bacterium]|nr:TIM barrel protein [Bryobacteraceae bacterium]